MTDVSETRLPALDGLRGVAILLVLVYHFGIRLESHTLVERVYHRLVLPGWSGVDLFFVLSGFLITGILIDARGGRTYFRTFYARRALRIFPLYYVFVGGYVFVVLPFLFGDAAALLALKADRWWFLFFGSNVLITLRETLDAAPYFTAALWSLAVEEQFYLWWPCLVALCAPSALGRTCMWVALLAAVFRVLVYRAGFDWGAAYLMPARMDTLALGGWLAVQYRSDPARLARLVRPMTAGAGALLLAVWVASGPSMYHDSSTMRVAGFSVVAVFYAGLVGSALVNPSGLLARSCSGDWLRTFGFYSFGIYIWHNPVRLLLELAQLHMEGLVQRGVPGIVAALAYTLCGTLLSLVAAVISWKLLEGPFNSLKRHVPYRSAPMTTATLVPDTVA